MMWGGLYFIMASLAVLAAAPGLNALHKLTHNVRGVSVRPDGLL